MTVTLRPFDPAADLPRLAALINATEPEPITVARLREQEGYATPEWIREQLVATDEAGRFLGLGLAEHEAWQVPGRFWTRVTVDPGARGRGIGAALADRALRFATAHGATRLDSKVRDDDPAALRFAERRGFRIDRHIFDSMLDPAAFDERPFAGAIAAAEATGIRFATLADLGDTPAWQRALYDLNRRVALDIPGLDGFAPYEEFRKWVFDSPTYRPERQLLALDGERPVGLAALGQNEETGLFLNVMTGVDRDYRGRGIALALKLLAIRHARAQGATAIRTNNDSQNAPILAINRRLGYRPVPGFYRLVREGAGRGA